MAVNYNEIATIPTVDMAPFLANDTSPEAVQKVVDSMRYACTTYGFFYLVGHGLTEAQRSEALQCTKTFHGLSKPEKMEAWIGLSMGKAFRGYEPPGIQVHQEGLLPDIKEAFTVGSEVPKDDPEAGTFSTGPNLWPKALTDDQLRKPIMQYHEAMLKLVRQLLKILSLGLPKEWNCASDALCMLGQGRVSSPMRLLHYAPQQEMHESQFGVGDHTDFGCISILLQQEDTEGLEVWYPPTESWVPVPVKSGSFVVNMGDTMTRVTSGYYRSARHRVLASGYKERHSVAFFLNGNLKLPCRSCRSGVASTTEADSTIGECIRARIVSTMGSAGKALK